MSTAQALSVFSTQVPQDQRCKQMHHHWGDRCVNLKMLVYGFMNRFNDAYNGGYWDFNITQNSAFYISLSTDKPVHLVNSLNFSSETMSADAAVVVLTIFACSYGLDKWPEDEAILNTFDLLMSVVGDHPESSEIYRLLD